MRLQCIRFALLPFTILYACDRPYLSAPSPRHHPSTPPPLPSPQGTRPLADLAALDLDTNVWTAPHTTGDAPGPRGQPSAVATTARPGRPAQLLLFGGWDGTARYGDLHALHVGVWRWERLAPRGPRPPPRSDHTCVTWHYCDDGRWKDLAVVFGGSSDVGLLADTWLYDVDTALWTQVGERRCGWLTPGRDPSWWGEGRWGSIAKTAARQA
jgi:hypothetical protein